ncbi:eukaryotic translation initiation factor 3 subunit G-like [Aphidius gifuensis]|uniref:eukaryotic translation initiation factor 3 subunit G-like n=1 Tax=Aphidius gifuensis TaxID=684658 RepID=UPI001CDD5DDA|nr:eukaryotic translation initiation factor 3 subunit G-like [Aphidius gifuensis]
MEQRESKNCRFDISMSENDPERDKKKLQNQLNHLKKSIDKKKEKGLDYLPPKITAKSEASNKKIPLGKSKLVKPFGHVKKLYIAKDSSTNKCKGFGYVHFKSRDDASRAIAHLNNYGYDNLILSVDWSTPSAQQL